VAGGRRRRRDRLGGEPGEIVQHAVDGRDGQHQPGQLRQRAGEIKGFGLGTLPAIVHVGQDLTVVNAVEGWDPVAWRALTTTLSRQMSWSRPLLPSPGDPGPFAGAPLPAS